MVLAFRQVQVRTCPSPQVAVPGVGVSTVSRESQISGSAAGLSSRTAGAAYGAIACCLHIRPHPSQGSSSASGRVSGNPRMLTPVLSWIMVRSVHHRWLARCIARIIRMRSGAAAGSDIRCQMVRRLTWSTEAAVKQKTRKIARLQHDMAPLKVASSTTCFLITP